LIETEGKSLLFKTIVILEYFLNQPNPIANYSSTIRINIVHLVTLIIGGEEEYIKNIGGGETRRKETTRNTRSYRKRTDSSCLRIGTSGGLL
jgi:hypothetical protein